MAETDQEDDKHFNLLRGGGWNIFKGTVRENDWLFAVRKIAGGGWLEYDACVERSGSAATQFQGQCSQCTKEGRGSVMKLWLDKCHVKQQIWWHCSCWYLSVTGKIVMEKQEGLFSPSWQHLLNIYILQVLSIVMGLQQHVTGLFKTGQWVQIIHSLN